MRRGPAQESLLPGTQAIKKGDLEICHYGRGLLVRFKHLNGYTVQRKFSASVAGRDRANIFFWECFEVLRAEVRRTIGGRREVDH